MLLKEQNNPIWIYLIYEITKHNLNDLTGVFTVAIDFLFNGFFFSPSSMTKFPNSASLSVLTGSIWELTFFVSSTGTTAVFKDNVIANYFYDFTCNNFKNK